MYYHRSRIEREFNLLRNDAARFFEGVAESTRRKLIISKTRDIKVSGLIITTVKQI
jgi:hypothetical protein